MKISRNFAVSALALMAATLAGCASKPLESFEAKNVEIVREAPNKSRCKLLGEVVGSQGNWFTGAFTGNKELIVGARNEIRNEAALMGGNLVHVQDMEYAHARFSAGNSNTTAIGFAYRCK